MRIYGAVADVHSTQVNIQTHENNIYRMRRQFCVCKANYGKPIVIRIKR